MRFLIKEDSGVSDDWILENVVPHIATRLGNSVATIMGRALLSACMEDEWIEAIPTELREEVQSAYTGIRVLEEGMNPVEKRSLIVYRVDNRLVIDELEDGSNDDNNDGAAAVRWTQGGGPINLLQGLVSQHQNLRREVASLQQNLQIQGEQLQGEI